MPPGRSFESCGRRLCRRAKMAEPSGERIDEALKQGLRTMAVPDPGSDFDDRVIAAVRARKSWWYLIWDFARPVVSAAACSAVIMLAALHLALQTPSQASDTQVTIQPPVQAAITMAALDRALDRPDLRFGTISSLFNEH